MATKKKGGIKVVHKEQRESLPANIAYRVLSVNSGGGTRIIGYTENYADADSMSMRHAANVAKISARIDQFENNEWVPLFQVKYVPGNADNEPAIHHYNLRIKK